MADITAKRGPRDPSEGLNNQGVATQAMLQSMAREDTYDLQKRAKKKSTWDSIMGGIGDVINIGKGVMDIANSYEDLQVKDEQIKASEVNRQRNELALEQSKQTMNLQSIQNEMQIKELEEDNKFLDNINESIKVGDTTGAATYALSHPGLSKKYQSAMLNIAKQLDKRGDTENADAFRLAASTGNPTAMANLMYGSSDSMRGKFANPQQYVDYKRYEAKVNALGSVFNSADNDGKLAKLGLGDSKNLPQDLLSCARRISTTNTINENIDQGEMLKSLNIDSLGSNLSSTTKTNGKNVQFLDITCPVDGVPHTERFVFDANSKIMATSITSKGLPGEEKAISVGAAISALISQQKTFKNLIKEPVNQTPVNQQQYQSQEVIDSPNAVDRATNSTQVMSSNGETQVKQKEELRVKDYTAYKNDVYKELKDTWGSKHLDNQAKGAIIENKISEMSQDPDALNSFINGPVSQVMATMNNVEKEALQMYVQKMSIPVKQEIARTIANYIGIEGRNDIAKLVERIKPIIERSKVYQDIVAKVKDTQERRDYVSKTFRSHF